MTATQTPAGGHAADENATPPSSEREAPTAPPAGHANDDAFCSDCLSLMIEDDGAGHLCPACDVHGDCEDFPCSGYDGSTCVLNAPLGSRSA